MTKSKIDHEDYMQLKMLTQLGHDFVKSLDATELMQIGDEADDDL